MKVWVCTIEGRVQEVASDMDIAYMWLKKQREETRKFFPDAICTVLIHGIGSFQVTHSSGQIEHYGIYLYNVRTTRGQMLEVA